jgi:hypothetical protein
MQMNQIGADFSGDSLKGQLKTRRVSHGAPLIEANAACATTRIEEALLLRLGLGPPANDPSRKTKDGRLPI